MSAIRSKTMPTCLFQLMIMLACVFLNSSIPSQTCVTDEKFLRQNHFEALLWVQTSLDTQFQVCRVYSCYIRIQSALNGAGTGWDMRSSKPVECFHSQKGPMPTKITKAQESTEIRIRSNHTCLFVVFNMLGWKNGVVNEPLAVQAWRSKGAISRDAGLKRPDW